MSSKTTNTNSTNYTDIGAVNISSQDAALSLACMLANTMTSRAVPKSASNNQNRIDILIPADQEATIIRTKNFNKAIRINGINISKEEISKISPGQKVLVKADSQGNITAKFEIVLLKDFSAYSCVPKDYHNHSD